MKNQETSLRRILAGLSIFCLMLSFVLAISCDADIEVDQTLEEIASAQPNIISFDPETANVGELVTIIGNSLQFVDEVTIGGVPAIIQSRTSNTNIVIEIPNNATSGLVTVTNLVFRENGQEPLRFESTSTQTLNVTFIEPIITSDIPDDIDANQTFVLEGENLISITSIKFNDIEAPIEFQQNNTIVFTAPNPETLDPGNLTYSYLTNSGETTVILSDSFIINIPTPEPSNVPKVMSRDNEVTIIGANMNFTSSVTVDGIATTITTTTPTKLTFMVPSGIPTGVSEVILIDTQNRQSVFNIPYINGEYFEMIDFDANPADAVSLNLSEDPNAVGEKISDPAAQPTLPDGTIFGKEFYRITYGTKIGNTVGRLKIDDNISTTELERLSNVLDGTSFGGDPVLHFWMRTENSPSFKIYLGSGGSPRRELENSFRNTNGNWLLIAVKLKDFISGGNFADLNFRLSPTAADSQPLIKFADYDWFIITDKVLTEFGALDYSDTTTTTNFWKPQ